MRELSLIIGVAIFFSEIVNVAIFLYLPFRNSQGKVLRPAPFQSSVKSGEVARVAPNRKWFGMWTCNINNIHVHVCRPSLVYMTT